MTSYLLYNQEISQYKNLNKNLNCEVRQSHD